jgi:sterigmatocystin biosynthesis cytochrome P450 monooxygenase
LGYQEQDSTLSSIMMSQLQWGGFTASRDLWKVLNPVRPFLLWNNKRQTHNYIGSQIDRRYGELSRQKGNGSLHQKSALSLALQDSATTTRPDGKAAEKLEKTHKATLVSQIMLFLIAGQDTTSTTITYCFHEIYNCPTALKRIRAEHSEVFGTDSSPSEIVSAIEKNPDRLNNLPYTSAIIKEALRLHPPTSIVRKGERGVTLTDDGGNIFPTAGCNIWVVHLAMQRDPKYFVEPDSFIPERWLAEPGDRLYPTKAAWRPFETGQRNCLGQALAMLIIKISILMVVRSFDIAEAYDEVAPEIRSKDGTNVKQEEDKVHRYGKAYPVHDLGLSIFPNAGYPCRITAVDA